LGISYLRPSYKAIFLKARPLKEISVEGKMAVNPFQWMFFLIDGCGFDYIFYST
jgi:hypothetical protein